MFSINPKLTNIPIQAFHQTVHMHLHQLYIFDKFHRNPFMGTCKFSPAIQICNNIITFYKHFLSKSPPCFTFLIHSLIPIFRNISFIHSLVSFSELISNLLYKHQKPHSPKSHSSSAAMTQTPYYHFIPTKAEEEKGEANGNFPLQPIRYELVNIRDESPQLLNLFDHPWNENPQLLNHQFEIKKVLTSLDVGNLGALVLDQEQVLNHICKYWRSDLIMGLMRCDEQVGVVIRDLDTKSEYNSFLKKSSIDESCFVISSNVWTRDFVYRRDLKEGDTIGLYWHVQSSSFCFSVLKRA